MDKKANTNANSNHAPSPQGATVGELVQRLGEHGLRVHLVGSAETRVFRGSSLEDAGEGDITFLANRKYIHQIDQTLATAVILPATVSGPDRLVQLKVDDSYYAFMLIMRWLHGFRPCPFEQIDTHAKVHLTVKLGQGGRIANWVTISQNTVIGENATIYPGCFIGPDCRIGDNITLYPNVVIYNDTVIGNNVTIHGGSVIAQDGFGYATHGGGHHKIPQIGNVVIEDDVEIGANCAVDRATMGSTVIGKGTKVSNLVAIGHGAKIGPHGLIVAQAGIAGSTNLGRYISLGGQVGIVGHISIGDNVTIAAQSGVTKNVEDGQTLFGSPAIPIQDAKRLNHLINKLPEMRDQLKRLQKRLDRLERSPDSGPHHDHPSTQQ